MNVNEIFKDYKYRTELHAHTNPVSSCGKFPADEVVKTYVDLGVNTLVITNHMTEKHLVGRTESELAEYYLSDYYKALEAAKGTDVKLYVSTFYQEGGSPEFDAGIKEYINTNDDAKTANGGDDTISAVTAMGYDAYYVALEAIKAADSADPSAIKSALGGVKYKGVSGDIAFDQIGDSIRDTAYIKTANTAKGSWVLETIQTVGK